MKETRHVKTYEISQDDKELLEGPWSLLNVEGGSSILVTLPKPLGMLAVIHSLNLHTYESGCRWNVDNWRTNNSLS